VLHCALCTPHAPTAAAGISTRHRQLDTKQTTMFRFTLRTPIRHARRSLSTLIDTSSFSPTQLEIRSAIGKVCAKFPDEYWANRDETGQYPHELHQALAKDGWIGICLPTSLGGAGLGISEATMMLQTISE
jgi:alkylation response protein AidB-like acyl-CoA dehydrogenase